VLVLVVVANSSGWANALGYFYSKNHKAKRTGDKNCEGKSNPTFSSVAAIRQPVDYNSFIRVIS